MLPLLHAAFVQFEIGFYSYDQGLIRGGFKDHLARCHGRVAHVSLRPELVEETRRNLRT